MADLREALEPLRAKFRSANRVPVERAVIRAEEWAPVEAALAEPAGEPRMGMAELKQAWRDFRDSPAGEPPNVSHAWKSGYAQAKDEAALDHKFCPHCNPCGHDDAATEGMK